MANKASEIIKSLDKFRQELKSIHASAHSSNDIVGWEKQARWLERLAYFINENISSKESIKCKDLEYDTVMGFDPFQNFDNCVNAYDVYLSTLRDEIKSSPDFWIKPPKTSEKKKDQGFIIPGVSSNFAKNKDIFLAHRFEERRLINEIKLYIEKNGYNWKEGKREDLGSISEDILTKIKRCGFFIAIMTKHEQLKERNEYTTSSWLIEEKGAALAFGHRPLIMVEEKINRHYVGFLQSDDEMIYFNRGNFEVKIVEALKKINNTFIRHNSDLNK